MCTKQSRGALVGNTVGNYTHPPLGLYLCHGWDIILAYRNYRSCLYFINLNWIFIYMYIHICTYIYIYRVDFPR